MRERLTKFKMGCKREYATISLISVLYRLQDIVESYDRLLRRRIIFCAPMSPMEL